MKCFSIIELNKMYQARQITPVEVIELIFLDIADNSDNLFITLCKKEALEQAYNLKWDDFERLPLWGIPYVAKDNFLTKDIRTTASCKILDNFIPNESAFCIEKLEAAGAILIGKANMDELGMCGTGLSSSYGVVKNPHNPLHIAGGSSSGSAAIIAKQYVPFALGTDTGDSVRYPASCCGVIGFKPSWNRISHYGIIPYTPSFDTVGILGQTISNIRIAYHVMQGYNPRDAISYNPEKHLVPPVRLHKIILIKEIQEYTKKIYPDVFVQFDSIINKLRQAGAIIEEINFDKIWLEAMLPVYNIITYGESTSCQAYLQGIAFGKRINGENWEETIIKTRTEGFGVVTKRRQLMGALFLTKEYKEKYFDKSKRVRYLIHQKLKKILANGAVLLTPNAGPAPLISQTIKNRIRPESFYDFSMIHFLFANFYGCPSLSLPIGKINNLPVGLSVTVDQYQDDFCLDVSEGILELINEKSNCCGGHCGCC